ncbi:MAG: hydroxyacid dehydrogenase [Zestosphaera sp.]
MAKILVTAPLHEDAMKVLRNSREAEEVVVLREPPASEGELVGRVADVDAIIAVKSVVPLTENVIMSAPKLKVIARSGIGYDNVDVRAATARGVWVTIAPAEEVTESVADHALALLLCLVRKVCRADGFIKSGRWVSNSPELTSAFTAPNLYGRTIGIVGLGRIGSRVARRAIGFGMKVIYYDIVRKYDLEERYGAELTPLERLLKESDFIVIAVPLTDQTRNMIGERELRLMKRTAFIINIARGPIINHNALVKALEERIIAGAALDVFYKEPLPPDDPLLRLDNVVLTPHIAANTYEGRKAQQIVAVEEALRVLRGKNHCIQ